MQGVDDEEELAEEGEEYGEVMADPDFLQQVTTYLCCYDCTMHIIVVYTTSAHIF